MENDLHVLHISSVFKEARILANDDRGAELEAHAKRKGLIPVDETFTGPKWAQQVSDWNGAVSKYWAFEKPMPVPLSVKFEHAGDLHGKAADLWLAACKLPAIVPEIARVAITDEANAATERAEMFSKDLGLNTEGYNVPSSNEDMCKLQKHLAARFWAVSGALEYERVDFNRIKLEH